MLTCTISVVWMMPHYAAAQARKVWWLCVNVELKGEPTVCTCILYIYVQYTGTGLMSLLYIYVQYVPVYCTCILYIYILQSNSVTPMPMIVGI